MDLPSRVFRTCAAKFLLYETTGDHSPHRDRLALVLGVLDGSVIARRSDQCFVHRDPDRRCLPERDECESAPHLVCHVDARLLEPQLPDHVHDSRDQSGGGRTGSAGQVRDWRSRRSPLSMDLPSRVFRTQLRHARGGDPVLLAMDLSAFSVPEVLSSFVSTLVETLVRPRAEEECSALQPAAPAVLPGYSHGVEVATCAGGDTSAAVKL